MLSKPCLEKNRLRDFKLFAQLYNECNQRPGIKIYTKDKIHSLQSFLMIPFPKRTLTLVIPQISLL